jgi:DNA ligase (NAD+)
MLELLRREERGTEEASGTFTSCASMNTDCVLANEEASSKLEKANALSVPVLDETAFVELLS